MLSKEFLCEIFQHENETGILRYIKKPTKYSNIKIGDIAGSIQSSGHLKANVLSKPYLVHRLIWIMYNGDIPESMVIDHIDTVKSNNRIENLRLATFKENCRNKKVRKNKSSIFHGVHWSSNAKKWIARYVNEHGELTHLGSFDSELEAGQIAEAAFRKTKGAFFNERSSVASVLAGVPL